MAGAESTVVRWCYRAGGLACFSHPSCVVMDGMVVLRGLVFQYSTLEVFIDTAPEAAPNRDVRLEVAVEPGLETVPNCDVTLEPVKNVELLSEIKSAANLR